MSPIGEADQHDPCAACPSWGLAQRRTAGGAQCCCGGGPASHPGVMAGWRPGRAFKMGARGLERSQPRHLPASSWTSSQTHGSLWKDCSGEWGQWRAAGGPRKAGRPPGEAPTPASLSRVAYVPGVARSGRLEPVLPAPCHLCTSLAMVTSPRTAWEADGRGGRKQEISHCYSPSRGRSPVGRPASVSL